jgi:hypothetical protein
MELLKDGEIVGPLRDIPNSKTTLCFLSFLYSGEEHALQAFVDKVPGKISGLQLNEFVVENKVKETHGLHSSQFAASLIYY